MKRVLFAMMTVIAFTARSAEAPKSNGDPAKPTVAAAPAVAGQAAPTYEISGTVSGAKEGVSMKLGGAATDNKAIDKSGKYNFANRADGLYTVTPIMAGYVFTPAARTAQVFGGNISTVDFSAAEYKGATHKILGSVLGASVAGVIVTISGQNTGETFTSASGQFEFPQLAEGTYTVRPVANGFSFVPATIAVTLRGDVVDLSFAATATSSCTAPSALFKWTGTRTAFLTTNARFKPTQHPTIRILGKNPDQPQTEDPEWSVGVQEVGAFRHCESGDANCVDQVHPVNFENARFGPNKTGPAPLLQNAGRVAVEFSGLQDCSGDVRVENVVALEQHHLAVDVGASFSLGANGSFASNFEAALNSYSRWTGWFAAEVDIRFVSLPKVEKPQDGNATTFLQTGGNTIDTAVRALFNVDSEARQPWASLLVGGGFRSLISGTDNGDAVVRGKMFAGARFQVLGYNAGAPAEGFGDTRGYFELGLAANWFWSETRIWRTYGQGQIEIPSVGSRLLRVLIRLKIDTPITQSGPSEARLSVLTSINPAELGKLLGFGG